MQSSTPSLPHIYPFHPQSSTLSLSSTYFMLFIHTIIYCLPLIHICYPFHPHSHLLPPSHPNSYLPFLSHPQSSHILSMPLSAIFLRPKHIHSFFHIISHLHTVIHLHALLYIIFHFFPPCQCHPHKHDLL